MSFPDLSSASFHRASKAGVLLALPIAILMLLICNSFDISVVRDSKAPFASIRIPVENVVYDDQAIFTF